MHTQKGIYGKTKSLKRAKMNYKQLFIPGKHAMYDCFTKYLCLFVCREWPVWCSSCHFIGTRPQAGSWDQGAINTAEGESISQSHQSEMRTIHRYSYDDGKQSLIIQQGYVNESIYPQCNLNLTNMELTLSACDV